MNRLLATTLLVLAALLCAAPRVALAALQGEVRFQMPSGDVYAGVPFRILVRVVDAKNYAAPTVPDIPGATTHVSVLGSSESQSIINGRVSRSTSITYGIDITPEQPGKLALPPISIVVDGREERTRPTSIDVVKNDATALFDAEVFGTPPEVFIGQPLELVLRIGIKPFRDPTYGQLNEVQMWQLVDLEGSEWGVFLPTLQKMAQDRREVPSVQSEVRDGATWFVYEVPRIIWPPKSGQPDLGRIVLRMKYPLGLREVRGFFPTDRQLTLTDVRPLATEARINTLKVVPLPDQGRPAGFTGAVGDFSVSAAAKPTQVNVGDPITLTLVITDKTPGGSNLDTLQPPDLSADTALTSRFRVPSEPLSGTVSGKRKAFTQTLRPLRADVTEIPPIAFSFFDPATRTYRTVATEAIPVTVRPADQMDLSRIVTASGTEVAPQPNPGTQLTVVEGGLMANKPVTPAILANERMGWTAPLALALLVPPLTVAGAAAWRVHKRRHERDAGLARRSRARRTAQRRLEQAPDAAAVARAVAGLVEDRLGRAEGTMTRGDLQDALAAHGMPEATRASVVALLAECDRARYAGGGGADLASLRSRAAAALDTLDQVHWRNGGAA